MAQTVRCLPAVWETQVQSLGREDTLERENGNPLQYSPGKSHGQRSLVGYSTRGHKESDMTSMGTKQENFRVEPIPNAHFSHKETEA